MARRSTTKPHTGKTYVRQAEYARMRGVTRSAVTQRITQEVFKTYGSKKLICVEEADAALRAAGTARGNARLAASAVAAEGAEVAAPQTLAGPANMTLHEARTLKAEHDAERSRIAKEREAFELDVLQDKYVLVSEVELVWSAKIARAKSRFLGVASDIKTSMPELPLEAIEQIEKLHREALEELANDEDPAADEED